jgi:hypothetical protein
MERHGGLAQVRSDGDGTEVRLRLPVLGAEGTVKDPVEGPDRPAPPGQQAQEATS